MRINNGNTQRHSCNNRHSIQNKNALNTCYAESTVSKFTSNSVNEIDFMTQATSVYEDLTAHSHYYFYVLIYFAYA